MAVFKYEALDSSGEKVQGELEAESRPDLTRKLGEQGIFPTQIEEKITGPESYASPMPRDKISCKVCDSGEMGKVKVFRMSPPIVVIGFLILIPSLIVLFVSFIGGVFIVASGAVSSVSKNEGYLIDDLRAKKVPEAIVEKVENGKYILPSELEKLTVEQQVEVEHAVSIIETQNALSFAGSTLGTGAFICLGFSAFFTSLFGGLLVMRKRVLKCNNFSCGAVVEAS